MKRRGGWVGLLLAVGLAVTACGGGAAPTAGGGASGGAANASPSAGAASGKLPVIRVATLSSGISGYELKLIKAEHLDTKHGIDLQPEYMDLTQLANSLKLGSADVDASLQPSTASLLTAKGTPLLIFGPAAWSGNQFVVAASAKGTQLSDFKGDTMGDFVQSSGAYFFSAVLAKLQGLDISKDFKLILSATAPVLVAHMKRGDLQIMVSYEPFTTQLIADGKYKVLEEFDPQFEKLIGSKALKAGLGATPQWLDAHAKEAAEMRDTFIEAAQMIQSGQDASFYAQQAQPIFGLATPQLQKLGHERIATNYATEWDQQLWTSQEKMIQTGVQLGLLPKNAPADVFWTKG